MSVFREAVKKWLRRARTTSARVVLAPGGPLRRGFLHRLISRKNRATPVVGAVNGLAVAASAQLAPSSVVVA